MLQKIDYIKYIGPFYDFAIKGTESSNPSFKKFNLIFGDNGSGKSTVSRIFKSLLQNDPQMLIAKNTIDQNNID